MYVVVGFHTNLCLLCKYFITRQLSGIDLPYDFYSAVTPINAKRHTIDDFEPA